ncbi:hypothetical protein HYH02_006625 [Chlamydomonas schloesseri]|uniref:Protein kinase domain-containing protein n=1 Tax=Chlamydomonas schloesseri TaxID=2026947 RepID=A0A835T5F7_9CHLO|nr:hypothetical protein HYH02_006625 [Chlamydomonas schloesseri]|eukprot:KAG2439103.1 hypothetical protein HYH02_006625 [Chlamydomonas schloesseri]
MLRDIAPSPGCAGLPTAGSSAGGALGPVASPAPAPRPAVTLDLRSLSGLFSVPANGTLELRGLNITGAALPSAPYLLPASGFLALSAFRLGAGARLRLVDSVLTVPSCALLSLHQTYACGLSPSPNVTVTPSSLVVHQLTTPSLDAWNVTVQCSGAAAPFPCLAASVDSGTELLAAVWSAQASSDTAAAVFGKGNTVLYLHLSSGLILLSESLPGECPDWGSRMRIPLYQATLGTAGNQTAARDPCPIIATSLSIVLQGATDGTTVLDLAKSTSLIVLETRAAEATGSVEIRRLQLRNPPPGPLGGLPYSLMRLPLWTFEFRRRIVGGLQLPIFLRVVDSVVELPPEEMAMWRLVWRLPLSPRLKQHVCLVSDRVVLPAAKLQQMQPPASADMVDVERAAGWSGSFMFERSRLEVAWLEAATAAPVADWATGGSGGGGTAATAASPAAAMELVAGSHQASPPPAAATASAGPPVQLASALPPTAAGLHAWDLWLPSGQLPTTSSSSSSSDPAEALAFPASLGWSALAAAKRAELLAAGTVAREPSMCVMLAPGAGANTAAGDVRPVQSDGVLTAVVEEISGQQFWEQALARGCFVESILDTAPVEGDSSRTSGGNSSTATATINVLAPEGSRSNGQQQVPIFAPAMVLGEPLGARVLDLAGLVAAVRLSGPGPACLTLRHLVLIGAPPASAPPAVWVASPPPRPPKPPSPPRQPASSQYSEPVGPGEYTDSARQPPQLSATGAPGLHHRRRLSTSTSTSRQRRAQQAAAGTTAPPSQPPPLQAERDDMTHGLAPALTKFTSCLWTFGFDRSPQALAADAAGGVGGRPAGLPRLFLDSVVLVVPEAELQLLGRVWAASADLLSGQLLFSVDTDTGLAAAMMSLLQGSVLGGVSSSSSSSGVNAPASSLWFPVISWCGYAGINVTLATESPAAAGERDNTGSGVKLSSVAAGTLIPAFMQLPALQLVVTAGLSAWAPAAAAAEAPPPAAGEHASHGTSPAIPSVPALATVPASPDPRGSDAQPPAASSSADAEPAGQSSSRGDSLALSVIVPSVAAGVVVGLAGLATAWHCRRRWQQRGNPPPQEYQQQQEQQKATDEVGCIHAAVQATRRGGPASSAQQEKRASRTRHSDTAVSAYVLAVSQQQDEAASRRSRLWLWLSLPSTRGNMLGRSTTHSAATRPGAPSQQPYGGAPPPSHRSPRAAAATRVPSVMNLAVADMLIALDSRRRLVAAGGSPQASTPMCNPATTESKPLSTAPSSNLGTSTIFYAGPHDAASLSQTQQPYAPPLLSITGELGRGAQGVVYRGVWRGLDVAVKSVLFHLELGPGDRAARAMAMQRAVQEAAIAVSMAHPNIVATYTYQLQPLHTPRESGRWVHAAGEASQTPPEGPCPVSAPLERTAAAESEVWKLTLIQELCDANSLRHCLQSGRLARGPQAGAGVGAGSGAEDSTDGQATALQPVPARTVLLLACDIARGLAYLHERGVVHADLSSNNVLLQSDRNGSGTVFPLLPSDTDVGFVAKLCDFGLSGRLDVEADATHLSGPARRSSAYSAPELVAHGRSGPAGDVYAFAVVLWELALGLPLPAALARPESASLRA